MTINPILTATGNSIVPNPKLAENVVEESASAEIAGEATPQASAPISAENNFDAAEAVVELKTYQYEVQASAKVVATADAVIGFLLDVG